MHIVKLLMFSVLPTKLLPGRYNLYGNSLEIQVKYMKEEKKMCFKGFQGVSKGFKGFQGVSRGFKGFKRF